MTTNLRALVPDDRVRRTIVEPALALGWTIRSAKGSHLALTGPAGEYLTLKRTYDDDRRAFYNLKAQARRVGLLAATRKERTVTNPLPEGQPATIGGFRARYGQTAQGQKTLSLLDVQPGDTFTARRKAFAGRSYDEVVGKAEVWLRGDRVINRKGSYRKTNGEAKPTSVERVAPYLTAFPLAAALSDLSSKTAATVEALERSGRIDAAALLEAVNLTDAEKELVRLFDLVKEVSD